MAKSQSLDYQRTDNKPHHWYLLESDHFNFYFEDSSEQIARSILPSAIEKLSQIEEKIGYRLSGRINIFTHQSVADLNATYAKQRFSKESIIGGITDIKNNDVHVYLTGSEVGLMEQISEAIAENLLIEMLYGGTIQERIKYATLLQLPTWFHEGLISYLSHGWDTESDNLLRDLFNNEQFTSFNKLSTAKQSLIGHSIWQYINDNEKRDAIEEILYSVRVTKKVETALLIVLNKTSKELYTEWYYANSTAYAYELKRRIPLNPESVVSNPDNEFFLSNALSPDASKIATAYRSKGKLRIDVLDRTLGETQTIYEFFSHFDGLIEYRNQLLFSWKDSSHLWLIENKTTPNLKLIDLSGHVLSEELMELDQINDMDYHPGENLLVFSGVKNGGTSLFLYHPLTDQTTQLTKSRFNDLEPHFDQSANIYFTRVLYKDSSRLLVSGWQKDIFYLFRSGNQVLNVTNVTNTLDVNEEQPIKLNSKYLSFLSDQNGIRNAYAYKLDQKTFALSNYQTSILNQRINQNRSHLIETVLHSGFIFTYVTPIDSSENFGAILHPSVTRVLQNQSERTRNAHNNNPLTGDSLDNQEANVIYFQSMFPVPHNVDSLDRISHTKSKQIDYTLKRTPKNVTHIQPTKAITQLHNGYFLTDEIGALFAPRVQMKNRLGPVIGIRLEDQFGNHVLEGRTRTTLNFNLFQYKVSYENRVGKYREKVQFIAEQTRYNQNIDLGKRRMRGLKFDINRQLTPSISVGGFQTSRYDLFTPILVDESSLRLEDVQQTTFDQGIRLGYNTSIKYTETYFHGVKAQFSTKLRYNATNSAASLVSEFSANYGRRSKKGAFWINRLHLGNSAGEANNIFVLGGNRNQYQPNINAQEISTAGSAFFQPVFGVRNFDMNVRSGTTYGFANTEYHIPLDYFLGKKPIKNSLFRNLWVVGFLDAGTAWYGRSPNDKRNVTNRTVVEDGRLNITIYNVKNPMVYSTGLGLRKKVFGYLVRYDLAWTYDNNVVNKAVSRVSLGKAF
ncbi:MAG: hypothetical protein JJ975_07675 [Bacteroidia bacterium]|nr:hypothetical protein [Bacteroidia bacterium]